MRKESQSLEQLQDALQKAWCAETSYAGADLPADNPAQAQCETSSLVVQDYYGGDFIRYAVRGEGICENHCANILDDGTVIDTTRMQYKVAVTMTRFDRNLGEYPDDRTRMLADDETRTKYELLKSRVETVLRGDQLAYYFPPNLSNK
jgi:hypothetical protein